MSKERIRLGKTGEDIAANYLLDRGLEIITRNFRDKFGEIDIIAKDSQTFVFVEVKTRRSDRFGQPEEAVTPTKQQQIIRVATNFLAQRKLLDAPVRFDVIGITMKGRNPEISHLISAFETC